MNIESLLTDCAIFAVDVCVLSVFYKVYKNESRSLKSVKEAVPLEINKELSNNMKENRVIPYAVISGNVKAISAPLRSKYFNDLRGVIQERITKEHKIRWNSFLHIWTATDNNIKRNVITVPFGLTSGNNSLFKKSVSVEVMDPFSSEDLVLSSIYDDYKIHENTFGESIFGFIWGERTVGIAEVENMLLEGTSLTAVGKLVIENDKLKITPPEGGLTYYLTPLSLESLIKKIESRVTACRFLTLVMCAVSGGLLAYFSKKWWKEIWRRIDHSRQMKKMEKERLQRRLRERETEVSNSDEELSAPKCIICLENPVEILILECGHACLCLECSGKIKDQCPVCRAKVQRLVAAFLP